MKPPQLLESSRIGLSDRLFTPVGDSLTQVRRLAGHELTHGCTAHLRLPPWLNEGLAMRTVDHVEGHPTVLESSRVLAGLENPLPGLRAYRRIKPRDHAALVRLYALGYWLVRRLEDDHPDLLLPVLEKRRSGREINRTVLATLGLK